MASLRPLLARLFSGPCAACGSRGARPLCRDCREASGITGSPLTTKTAGRPLFVVGAYRSTSARGGPPSPLGRCVRAFKDAGDRYAGRCAASLFAEALRGVPETGEVVVPVPPDPSRLRERGHHAASWLAAALARRCTLRLETDSLRRRPVSTAQRGLDGAHRRRNARDCFEVGRAAVEGYAVLLVDDVVTTGATLDAAATRLEESGARRVRCAVLAAADEELGRRCRSRTGNDGTGGMPSRRR